MFNRLKPKSEFSRNVLTLMTGTTIAQAIPIAISPILTRIYTPEDFGIVGVYASITGIIGSIVTGKYELAIMLPKKDEDAINIFALGLIIMLMVTFLFTLFIFFFGAKLALWIGHKEVEFWLYFTPISIFFIGLFNLLNYFNNRKKYYKDIANAVIIKSIVSATVQLSVGFIKGGVVGLISGNLSAQLASNAKLIKNILQDKVLLLAIKPLKILALAKRYKDFPKFTLWAGLSNVLATNMSNLLISIFFGIGTLGFYGLAQRILGMPSMLIGNAMSQVFYQQAVKAKQENGTIEHIFIAMLKKLLIISIPFFILLYIFVEDVFVFVFGERWQIAGEYAHFMIILFAVRFVSSPLAITLSILERQKENLWINIILLIAMGLTFMGVYVWDFDFQTFLTFFVGILSCLYMAFLLYYYLLIKSKVYHV